MTEKDFMRRAIEISAQALDDPGLRPYGAVVVKDGRIMGEGVNRSVADLDPTSHGETEAIRDACRNLGRNDLSGCTLYASCEPCPLCVAAMLIAGVERLVYAVSAEDGARIMSTLPGGDRGGVSVATLRAQTGRPAEHRDMTSGRVLAGEAQAVLQSWCDGQSR